MFELDVVSSISRSHPLFPFMSVVVLVLGCCIGSFLNVVIWRVPRGESIASEPSHCPSCNYLIPWYLNIPVLSWLLLRGRCGSCGAPFSARYPLVEGMTGILFLGLWYMAARDQHPLPLAAMVAYMILCALLVAITFIDLDHMIIPDSLSLTGLLVAFSFAIIWPASHDFTSAPMLLQNLNHKPVTMMLAEQVLRWHPGLLQSARQVALLDAFGGLLLGGGFLWALCEGGKLLWGNRRIRTPAPVDLIVEPAGFRTTEDDAPPQVPWDDLFMRPTDRLRLQGELTELTLAPEAPPAPPVSGPIELVVSDESVKLGEQRWPRAQVLRACVRGQQWYEPREVLGLGDVKLLGVLGAFLGPGACIFILTVSSVLGSLVGLALILLRQGKLSSKLPYGPYIALAAMLYIFLGDTLIYYYLRLVLFVTAS